MEEMYNNGGGRGKEKEKKRSPPHPAGKSASRRVVASGRVERDGGSGISTSLIKVSMVSVD